MRRVTLWVVSTLIRNHADTEDPAVRAKVGLLEGWTSIAANTALAALKAVLGFATGSVSLLGDAANNLSDLVVSGVVILGFRVSQKPADEEHPFGHGRMESIAGIMIGMIFAVVAFEVFRASVERILHPRMIYAPDWLIALLAGTMVVKWLLSRFAHHLGNLIESETLHADGRNHLADVFATALVVVAFIAVHWGIAWIDGVMGVGVSVFIAWAAYKTVRGATDPLLGQHAPQPMYEEIERIARAVPGVQGVHDILVNRYGFLNIISLHIEVSATEAAMRLHQMCDEIELKLGQRYPGHAIVHVDPLNTDHSHYSEVQKIVAAAVAEEPGLDSFHDLRLIGGGQRFKVVFDAVPKRGGGEIAMPEFRQKVLQRLRERFPRVRLAIDLEPPYFHNVHVPRPEPKADGPSRA